MIDSFRSHVNDSVEISLLQFFANIQKLIDDFDDLRVQFLHSWIFSMWTALITEKNVGQLLLITVCVFIRLWLYKKKLLLLTVIIAGDFMNILIETLTSDKKSYLTPQLTHFYSNTSC